MLQLLKTALAHCSVILSMLFITFVILDIFNPGIHFVENTASRILLVILCICAGATAYLSIFADRKKNKS
ncbi:MAG: hypothetical protein QM689_05305 [Oscillospiraceae bacterium]